MNHGGFTKTLIVFFVIIILSVAGFFIFSKKEIKEIGTQIIDSITERKVNYINRRLGYVVELPKGYRIASDYTKFINTVGLNPVAGFTDENAEYVLVTKDDRNGELRFLTEAKEAAESEDFLFISASALAQSSLKNNIEIYPIPVSIDRIKELAIKMRDSGRNTSSDFRQVVLADGTTATRYIERNMGNNEIFEVVYIPLRTTNYLRDGDKIEGITIKMNKRNEIFNNVAFEELIGSFRFIQ